MGPPFDYHSGMERGSGGSGEGGFFVVDGVDGCGKSTQAALLARALGVREGLHLREPGSTRLGERLRELLLLQRELELEPAVEVLLFAAARRQLLEEVVTPALRRGETIVCERGSASTYAYQAVAGALDEERVLALLAEWCGKPAPELTLVLDLDVEEAARRRGEATDRIEAKGLDFQRRVAEGFRRYAERVEGVVVVDAAGEPEEVHARVMEEVSRVGR